MFYSVQWNFPQQRKNTVEIHGNKVNKLIGTALVEHRPITRKRRNQLFESIYMPFYLESAVFFRFVSVQKTVIRLDASSGVLRFNVI